MLHGGIVYVTIHSEYTRGAMNPDWAVDKHLLHLSEMNEEQSITRESFAPPLPRNKTVFGRRADAASSPDVFYHSDSIRTTRGRLFEVLGIIQEGSDYQDVVVMRKP